MIYMRSGIFWLRYRTPSGSGKYTGFGLRMETGTARTTIVDIFDCQIRAHLDLLSIPRLWGKKCQNV